MSDFKLDEKFEISQITDYLYLCGCHPISAVKLANLGITCAINCIRGVDHKLPVPIEYVSVPVEDEETEQLEPHFRKVIKLITKHRDRGGKTLVYCGLGISRSASFVIAYFIDAENMNLHDAYKRVVARRSIICPNVGFFKQLIQLEHKVHGKKTVKIIEAAPGVFVADVVWLEIYDEVMRKLENTNLTLDYSIADDVKHVND